MLTTDVNNMRKEFEHTKKAKALVLAHRFRILLRIVFN